MRGKYINIQHERDGVRTPVSDWRRFRLRHLSVLVLSHVQSCLSNIFRCIQIGYVGQEPVLFQGTILENIKKGAPGASVELIQEAAKAANAHDFIMSFNVRFDVDSCVCVCVFLGVFVFFFIIICVVGNTVLASRHRSA